MRTGTTPCGAKLVIDGYDHIPAPISYRYICDKCRPDEQVVHMVFMEHEDGLEEVVGDRGPTS